ncbi:MAG: hypothetical protein KDC35_20800 [Acidobacteria bacterium]|nr:hypothetical protein [Acidobacteriota bacterium]
MKVFVWCFISSMFLLGTFATVKATEGTGGYPPLPTQQACLFRLNQDMFGCNTIEDPYDRERCIDVAIAVYNYCMGV